MIQSKDVFDDLIADAEEPEFEDNSRAIEETLLVALFASVPEAVAQIIKETKPSDFDFEDARALASLTYPRKRLGKAVDLVTLKHDADASRFYDWEEDVEAVARRIIEKAQAEEAPSLGTVLSYLDIFVGRVKRRAADEVIIKAREGLKDGELDPEVAAAQTFAAIVDLEAAQRLTGAGQTEADDFGPWFEDLKARQGNERGFLGLDTGFGHVNNVLGGLMPGRLTVVGGMPGTGKTTFAKQLADNIVEANPNTVCLFVSLEMSKEELRLKSIARLSGVENRDIRHGRLKPTDPSNAWKRVEEAAGDYREKYADRLIIIEGDRYTTPDRIRLEAAQARQRTKADRIVVFVDYLQIVPTEKDFRDRREQVDFVTSELRRVARDLKISVVVLSSVNRGAYSKEQGALEHFKESGGIDFGADAAGLLMREGKDKAEASGSDQYLGLSRQWKKVFFDIVKNRDGETSRIGFRYYPAVDCFQQLDKMNLPEDNASE